jgi:hypothetical protein
VTLQQRLENLNACSEARQWVGDKSLPEAWATCERPDWVLWLAGRTPGLDVKLIVKSACEIARLSLKYVPEGENRPLKAIDAAEVWVKNPTQELARAAADAAADAAYAAADAAYAAADAETRKQCCDIIRKHIPVELLG